MTPLIISLFDEHPLIKFIAKKQKFKIGKIMLHDFPDGESYIKFQNSLQNRELVILNSLDRPNQKILPLLFAAETAKAIGAKRVGLCAPYLAYMRQDKQFKTGEGITSDYFAKLLSHYFDWLITVDPHLHRHHNLSEIYTIQNTVLHAASQISHWITKAVNKPVLIGPDSESEQWVNEIAKKAGAPYLILKKIRHNDRNVEISLPEITPYLSYTPVLIDDIISTAHTMITAINQLKKAQMKPPVCIGVHAVFADNAYQTLQQAGAAQVISCNTIKHPSNQIDLAALIGDGIQRQLAVI